MRAKEHPKSELKCTAHSKRTGLQCGQNALLGTNVCQWHGGMAPQVQAKAMERITEMVAPALYQLQCLMEEAETDAVKLSAVKDILDRAGYKPKDHIIQEVHMKRLIGVPEEEI